MIDIARVYEYGKTAVGDRWGYRTLKNLNRLYYIHSKGGTYIDHGKEYDFIPGNLYFIPYMAKIMPKSNKSKPMIHSYVDFELIPPINADRPIVFNPKNDKMIAAACKVFLHGVEQASKGKFDLYDSLDVQTELCLSAVKYLVVQLSETEGFFPLDDKLIIDVLEYMMENLSSKLKISEVSEYFFMNEDTFIRRFSKTMHMTPYAWIKSARIKTARSLMKNGLSLSAAAVRVGYSDASSLLHAIKNQK